MRSPADRFRGYGKLLAYYPQYGLLGLRALPRMKDYDVIVAWEGKNGVPLAFLRTLLGRRRPPLVIINFVLKGEVVLDNLWFIRLALRSVDHLTCVSRREIEHYARVLRLPAERFSHLLTFHPDHHGRPFLEQGDYILAAGRSHRDYGTLIQAVQGLPLRLVINARPFNLKGLPAPENVTFNPFLPQPEFIELVRRARFAVLPLHPAQHASGETFLLEAYAAGKPVIASETYSTVEFVQPGVNGYLVPPGDVNALRERILALYDDRRQIATMGLAARRFYEENCSFPVTARKVDRLLHTLVGE